MKITTILLFFLVSFNSYANSEKEMLENLKEELSGASLVGYAKSYATRPILIEANFLENEKLEYFPNIDYSRIEISTGFQTIAKKLNVKQKLVEGFENEKSTGLPRSLVFTGFNQYGGHGVIKIPKTSPSGEIHYSLQPFHALKIKTVNGKKVLFFDLLIKRLLQNFRYELVIQ